MLLLWILFKFQNVLTSHTSGRHGDTQDLNWTQIIKHSHQFIICFSSSSSCLKSEEAVKISANWRNLTFKKLLTKPGTSDVSRRYSKIFRNRSWLLYLFQVISEQDKNHKRGWWFKFCPFYIINIFWFTQELTEVRQALFPFCKSLRHSTLEPSSVNTLNISLTVEPLLANLEASSSPGPD